MSEFNIEHFLDLSGYDTDTRKNRRKGAKSTQEFFTPYAVIKKMCDNICDDDWKDPTKTFCDPSCGNGQIILYILYKRLTSNIDLYTALSTLYGVELMQDNVNECKNRIFKLLDCLCISYQTDRVNEILDKNIVCCDFFKWDFENWKPLEKASKKLF